MVMLGAQGAPLWRTRNHLPRALVFIPQALFFLYHLLGKKLPYEVEPLLIFDPFVEAFLLLPDLKMGETILYCRCCCATEL